MAKKFDPKARAKRQKIIAAVLGVAFLGVLAYQVPYVLSSTSSKPPADASSQSATPTPTPAPVAATPAAGTPAPVSATPSSDGLGDSDPSVLPSEGQLVSFGRFESKDPFAQQLGDCDSDTTSGAASACPTTGPAPEPSSPPSSEPKPSPQPAPAPARATAAVISVNGANETVAVDSTFPQEDPVFKLVSISGTTAKITVDGGSLSSGAATVTLTKGKPVTLVNTADGTRYVVVLVSTTTAAVSTDSSESE